jgi:hypothetical protein
MWDNKYDNTGKWRTLEIGIERIILGVSTVIIAD